jgi:signal transduction histidine kinase
MVVFVSCERPGVLLLLTVLVSQKESASVSKCASAMGAGEWSMSREAMEIRGQERSAFADERPAGQIEERLIAVLGNDLRHPLQAIFASSDLLERQLLSPAHVEVAERIKANAHRMATLIDEVLDFARGRLGGGIGATLTEITDVNAGLMTVIHELRDGETDYRILPDFQAEESQQGFVPRRTNSLKC